MENADCPNLDLRYDILQLPFTILLVMRLLSCLWMYLLRHSGTSLFIHLKGNLRQHKWLKLLNEVNYISLKCDNDSTKQIFYPLFSKIDYIRMLNCRWCCLSPNCHKIWKMREYNGMCGDQRNILLLLFMVIIIIIALIT